MSKREEMEREAAIREIEEKFGEPEYKGEKIFNLVGIICAGITISMSISRLYNSVDLYIKTNKTMDLDGFTALSVVASWCWALSAVYFTLILVSQDFSLSSAN